MARVIFGTKLREKRLFYKTRPWLYNMPYTGRPEQTSVGFEEVLGGCLPKASPPAVHRILQDQGRKQGLTEAIAGRRVF